MNIITLFSTYYTIIIAHSFIILLYMKDIFQKVSVCVLTHLIGQNGRAVCTNRASGHRDANAVAKLKFESREWV